MCDQVKSIAEIKNEQKTSDTLNVPNEYHDGACISAYHIGNHEISNVAKMVTHRYEAEYKMSHKRRGLALIFSHEHFKNKILASRPQTDIDSDNLNRVLTKLGFEVRIHKDLCYKQLQQKIQKAVAMDHSDNDCILIALLTNGTDDNYCVYARDEAYKVDSIWESFTADKCPTLAGKPKLFIIQACRGNLRDQGFVMKSKGYTETESDSNSNYKIPIYADFIIGFCTIPNYSSWKNPVQGSWFIYNLCEELEANGKKLDMLNLLTFVSQRVSNYESYETQGKQIGCTMSTLTRILRFNDKS